MLCGPVDLLLDESAELLRLGGVRLAQERDEVRAEPGLRPHLPQWPTGWALPAIATVDAHTDHTAAVRI